MTNLNYLLETYGGSKVNMIDDASYYCYTIYDKKLQKYYSGSRGVKGRNMHDLMSKYFTSSTVVDFKNRLKSCPSEFEFIIEYFPSRKDAFFAEKKFHQQFNVGKNKLFLNSLTSGGTNCGAGTVLCRDDNGKTYRVSVEEFASGRHNHVSKGTMNIRTENGVEKINKNDFDPNIHRTEFKDYVLSLDTVTGITCRIPLDTFYGNDRYVGITHGIVVAKDTISGETVTLTEDEFNLAENGRYVGHTHGMVSVVDRATGKSCYIRKEEFDKSKYMHYNEGKVSAYSLSQRKNVTISKEEYARNSDDYANQTTKCFYIVDNIFFKSKSQLDEYYKRTRNKSVISTGQFDISKKFNDIVTITKEEHQRGKN